MSENHEDAARSTGAGYETVMANPALGARKGLVPASDLLKFGMAALRQPLPLARRAAGLASDLAHIAIGVDTRPGSQDRRFADRSWSDNPALKRLAQGYLATATASEDLVDDVELDPHTTARLHLLVDNYLAAVAPTNNFLTNPSAWKEAIDTGGKSLVRGAEQLVTDMRSPTKLPTSVDKDAYQIGENLAATPGKVIRRTRLYELIQYEPTAEEVDVTPTLIVPSPVNKFYVLDLEPEQSVVAAEAAAGRNLFVVSWVNPDASHSDVGVDDYVSAVVELIETVSEVSGAPSAHLLGMCGGGLIVFLTTCYLAAVERQELLASLTVGIAVFDYEPVGPAAYLDRTAVDTAIDEAKSQGYFSAKDQARSFALIRPVEGIWDAAVRNYLLGLDLPKMGLLYWAADQTNMAIAYGTQMLELALDNGLMKPGAVTILGHPIDTHKITIDTYILAASTDHISPWEECYHTATMVSGPTTFVLAKGGHAISIARPPGSTRASYRTGEITSADPQEWLAHSVDHKGSWWENWNEWVEKLTPEKRPAPEHPGSLQFPPLDDAPGEYVKRMVT